jgi:hypothetical protein
MPSKTAIAPMEGGAVGVAEHTHTHTHTHTRRHNMVWITVPHGAAPPFAHQSMQEVVDRLGTSANSHKFLAGAPALRHGVLVSASTWMKHTAHHDFISTKMLAVADRRGEKSLVAHLSFERAITAGQATRWLPRAGVCIASRENLCAYVASLVSNPSSLRGFNINANGLYWEQWHPQRLYVHPYLDIDIPGIPDTAPFHDIFKFVFMAIEKCNAKFALMRDDGVASSSVAIFFNKREVNGRFKFSFHVHWPELVVPNTTTLGAFVQEIAKGLPMKPKYNEEEGLIEGTESLLDTKPYSCNQQLFRLPYCGKMGNDNAKLVPIRVHQDMLGKWSFLPEQGDVAGWISKSCTHTAFNEDYVELRMNFIERGPILHRRDALPASGVIRAIDDSTAIREKWLAFWMPVLRRIVLKNFVVFRQKQMSTLGAAASSPDPDNIIVENFERLSRYAASFRIEVHGDNFCEYDTGATPYRHKGEDNAISYVVDLSNGKIAQQCHKCRPAHVHWRTFIQTGRLGFFIQSGEESLREGADVASLDKSQDPVNFFLLYHEEDVLYCKEKKQVMVYNKAVGVWQGGSDGNRLLLKLVDALNSNYQVYRRSRNSKIADEKIAQFLRENAAATNEEKEKGAAKLTDDCRKANAKTPNLWQLTMAQRTDLIAKLRHYDHPNERETMESFHHLIPLNNCKCVDIYTFAVYDIKPEHYFTSTLNGSIIDLRDETVTDFMAWQNNVCCGDQEYITWKYRIMGLSLTLMNFDRSTYIPLGPIGRNGKSSEAALFNAVTMSKTPNRGYNLSREYLTKTSQDKKGANAPDTVLMETSDKCVVVADECRDTPLDGSLIKSFVSGDKASARNLYENERTTITSYFTLWIIANTMLKVDCTDAALVNRLRFMPYNAQWVTDVAGAKKKLGFPANLYIFKEDPYFKDRTLPQWKDAMITKTLYELHLFLKSLPRDEENPERPSKLESFPVPKAVRDYTRDRVQREHPLLAFIQLHLGQTEDKHAYVAVDVAFQQFRQFGRNENSGKIKYMNRSQFQEGLMKENIDVEDVGEELRLSGYYIKKDVINRDKPIDVPDNFSYAPPPAKRPRVDESEVDAFY